MRPLRGVLSDIEAYLKERGKTPDEDYLLREMHYTEISRLLRINDYPALIKHINNGLDEFWKLSVFKQKYHSYLLELKAYFVPKNEEDKASRLKKLFEAIDSPDDPKKVDGNLEAGGIAVINEKNSALKYALEKKNYSAAIKLIMRGAKISADKVYKLLEIELRLSETTPNAIIDKKENYTMLHLASALGLTEIVENLLKKGADPALLTRDGRTALHLACGAGNEETAISLLKNNPKSNPNKIWIVLDPDLKDVGQKPKLVTPLELAVGRHQKRLVEKLLAENVSIEPAVYTFAKRNAALDPKNYASIFKQLREAVKAKKNKIISENLPIIKANEAGYASSVKQIASQLYFEDSSSKDEIVGKLNAIYTDKNTILKPMIDLVAIAAQGQHIETKQGKPLKGVFSKTDNVNVFVPVTEESISGIYTGKRTVFVAGEPGIDKFGTFLHELKHFADKEIMRNPESAYKAVDQKQLQKIRLEINQFILVHENDPISTVDSMLSNNLLSIFKNYPPKKHDVEIMVRVPHIIGMLGVEKGYQWLKENLPELLKFHETVFNPACIKHIEKLKQRQLAVTSNKYRFFEGLEKNENKKEKEKIEEKTELKQNVKVATNKNI